MIKIAANDTYMKKKLIKLEVSYLGIKLQRNSKWNDRAQYEKQLFIVFEFLDSKIKRILIPTVNQLESTLIIISW